MNWNENPGRVAGFLYLLLLAAPLRLIGYAREIASLTSRAAAPRLMARSE